MNVILQEVLMQMQFREFCGRQEFVGKVIWWILHVKSSFVVLPLQISTVTSTKEEGQHNCTTCVWKERWKRRGMGKRALYAKCFKINKWEMCSNSSHTERYWNIRILKSLSTTLLRILPKQYEKARVSTYSSLLKVTDRRKQGFN